MALIDSLVSYYSCDDNGSFPDAHGSNNGTINGASFTASGLIDNAYDFDGINDDVDVGDFGTIFDGTADFSISMWVKGEAFAGADTIIGFRDGTNNQIRFTGGDIDWFLRETDATQQNATSSVTTFNTGTWYHLIFVFDSGGTGMKVYIDTVNDGSNAFNGGIQDSGLNNHIGSAEGSNAFDGIIDEVGIWSKALSSQERSDLYNAGAGLAYPFTIASITVISPNGGESIVGGTTHEITWGSEGGVGDIHIEYSDDNGGSYSDVIASTDNDGSYNWNVPNAATVLGLIRISEASDSNPTDVSDATFTVTIEAAGTGIDPTKTKGTAEIATRYPVTSGLIAKTTKQKGRQSNLVPEQGSIYARRKKIGFE